MNLLLLLGTLGFHSKLYSFLGWQDFLTWLEMTHISHMATGYHLY